MGAMVGSTIGLAALFLIAYVWSEGSSTPNCGSSEVIKVSSMPSIRRFISKTQGPFKERQNLHSTLANTLTRTIHTMLSHTSSDRGRSAVPLITNAAGISPFPIQITVKIGDLEVS